MTPAVVASLLTLASTILLEVFRRLLTRAKDRDDIGRAMRDELRSDLKDCKKENDDLEKENDRLRDENAQLKDDLKRSKLEFMASQSQAAIKVDKDDE